MSGDRPGPVAVFDSGVGGLSVLRHVRSMLPDLDLMYIADQAHVPYGPRPAREVRDLVTAVTRFCLQQGARAIVLACNTATAAALHELRATFPQVPFVGMEPAVKPGAAATRTGKVGVLATSGTFESQRYADLMARFARDVVLYENPCTGLVPLIEAGRLEDEQTRALLHRCMEPMLRAGVDTIVLGCTHYPFVLPAIRSVAGSRVTIIDPAPAVARQLRRVLAQNGLSAGGSGSLRAYTTGSASALAALAQRLLGYEVAVSGLRWRDGTLYRCEEVVP
ncbi:MAG: glutamate racemase [Chloroflexota bacterium]